MRTPYPWGNPRQMRLSDYKPRPMPLWSRCIASILIVLQFLTLPGSLPMWAETTPAAPTTTTEYPQPVRTQVPKIKPQHITLLKSNPDFSPHFSKSPADKELTGVVISEEPLVVIGGATTPAENEALAAAVIAYSQVKNKEDVSSLTGFLSSYPQSAWKASILTNLGLIYRKYGYYSRAVDAWSEAWKLSKAANDPTAHAVADRAVSELAKLLSTLGRSEVLRPLLIEVNHRPMYGPAATTILNAKEGLTVMTKHPGISFKCGPYALGSIYVFVHPKQQIDAAVFKAQSSTKGFSLDQLVHLSQTMKLNYQAAKRRPDAAFIVPSVVHWKSGHYAAILKQSGNSYLVKDPTFQGETVLSKAALEDEASGYFLVPSGPLPIGWTQIDSKEAKGVFGRGFYLPRLLGATKCDDPSTGGGCAHGMPVYSIKLLLACLHLEDIPCGYTPPVGPEVNFKIGYNQYEASHTGSFIFSNFGSDWVSDWIGYVQGAPSTAPSTGGAYSQFSITLRGGGYESYNSTTNPYTSTATGSETNIGYYGAQLQGHAVLYVTPSTAHTFPQQLRYERHMQDGSIEIYDSVADSQGNIFLTQVIDPQGNSVTLGYDSVTVSGLACIRLRTLTDAIGQVTNLNYGLSADPLKITQVTDPFGRSASFTYTTSTPYQLVATTDVIGMTSKYTYAPGTDMVTALTTPYGTTKFNSATFSDPNNPDDAAPDRILLVTDPNGGQEKVFACFQADQFDTSSSESLPNSTTYPFTAGATDYLVGLQHQNTFYWDRRAMLLAPNDLSQAHLYHWLIDPATNGAGSVIYSEKKAMESRIWYNYDRTGSSYGPQFLGNSDQPTGVLRLLDNGTSQYYQYTYNLVGNVTQSVDPAGRTLTYDYDTTGINLLDVRQTQGSNNDAQLKVTYYPSPPSIVHRPQYVYDASGQKTTYTYNTTTGQLLSITNPNNEITVYNYTGSNGSGIGNYLTSRVGPAASGVTGDTISYIYDAYGRIYKITDSQGNFRRFDYDALDRPTIITYPDGTYEQFSYDRLDLAWHRDRLGHWTHNTYDALRHLLASTDPLNRTTTYSWCVCGALSSLTDARGDTTTFNRDVESRVTAKIYPDSSQDQYTYENTTSRLKKMVDAKGQETDYSYNVDNTLSQIGYLRAQRPTSGVSFAYDSYYNRLTSMTDGTGETSYYYNPYTTFSSSWPSSSTTGAGRLGGESSPLTGGSSSSPGVTYAYDNLGRSLGYTIADPSSATNTYSMTYDSLDRLSTAAANNLGTFTNTYLSTTSLVSSVTYPSSTGVLQNNAFYDSSHPQDIERLQEIKYTNGTTAISKHDYSYDADGDITTWQQQTDSSSPNSYANSYDNANQLSEALLTDSSSATIHRYAYGYDSAGNRTSQQTDLTVTSGAYNNLNQLQSTTGGGPLRFSGTVNQNSTVTLNGSPAAQSSPTQFTGQVNTTSGTNVVTVVAQDTSGLATTNRFQVVTAPGTSESLGYDFNGNETSDGSHTYEWDVANRITAINYTSTGNRTEFTYDGLGRRIKIVEKTSSGTVTSTKQFVFIGQSIAEERDASGAVTKQFYPQGMSILSGYSTTGNFYYTRDHLGSVRELLSSTGTIVSRLNYDSYGNVTMLSGTLLPDIQYGGYYRHQPSLLSLTIFRVYDSNTARWLSRDPSGESTGINLYDYVMNDPLKFYDPLGMCGVTYTFGAADIFGVIISVTWDGWTLTAATVNPVVGEGALLQASSSTAADDDAPNLTAGFAAQGDVDVGAFTLGADASYMTGQSGAVFSAGTDAGWGDAGIGSETETNFGANQLPTPAGPPATTASTGVGGMVAAGPKFGWNRPCP